MLLSRSDSTSPEGVLPSAGDGPRSPSAATRLPDFKAKQPIGEPSSHSASVSSFLVPAGTSARRASQLAAEEQAAQDVPVAPNGGNGARHPKKTAKQLIRGIMSSTDASASSNFQLIKHSLVAARALGGNAWNPVSAVTGSGHKQQANGLNKLRTAMGEAKQSGVSRQVLPSRMFRTLLQAVTFDTMWRQGQAEQDKGRDKWDSDKEATAEMQDDQWQSLQRSIAKAIRSRVDKIARMEADLRAGLAPVEAVRAEMQRKHEEKMERIQRRQKSRMAIVDHLHRGVFEPQSSIAAHAATATASHMKHALDSGQQQEMRALNGLARAENISLDSIHGSYQAQWDAQDTRAAAATLACLHGANTTGSRASAPCSPAGGTNAAVDTTKTESTDCAQKESKRGESPLPADASAGRHQQQHQPRPARHARRRRSSIVGAVLALPRGRTSPPLLASGGSGTDSGVAAAVAAGSATSGAATASDSGEHLLALSQASADARPSQQWQGGAESSIRAGDACDSDSAHLQSSTRHSSKPGRAPDTVSGFRSTSPQRDAAALLARVVAKEARVSLKGVRAQVPIGTFIRMSRAKEKLEAPPCVVAEPPRRLQGSSQAVSHQPFDQQARQTEALKPLRPADSSKGGGGAMPLVKTSAAQRRPARTRASIPSAGTSGSGTSSVPTIGQHHTSVSRPAQCNQSRPEHRSPKPLRMRRYGPAGSSPGIEYPFPRRPPALDHQTRHEGRIRDYTAACGQPTFHSSGHAGMVHSPIATLVEQARSATIGANQNRGGTDSLYRYASGARWTPEQQQQRGGVRSRAVRDVRPKQAMSTAPSPLRLRRGHGQHGASLSRLNQARGSTKKVAHYPYAAALGAAKPKPRRLVPLKLRCKKGP